VRVNNRRIRTTLLGLLFWMSTSGQIRADVDRELVYLSRAEVRDLLGCSWGDSMYRCPTERLNTRLVNELWKDEALHFWYTLCLPRRGAQMKFVDCAMVWLPGGNRDADSLVLLVEERSEKRRKGNGLAVAYHVRGGTVLEEYRPLYGKHDLPLGKYQRTRLERRERSTDLEDLRSYRISELTSANLRQRLGFAWGANPKAVGHALRERGFLPESLEKLWVRQGWFLPQWRTMAKALAPWGTSNVQALLFCNRDSSRIKLGMVNEQALLTVFEYSSAGDAEWIRPPEWRSRFTPVPPWNSGYDGWGEARHTTSGKWRRIADPRQFFATWGKPFEAWRKRFEASRATMAPDLSWSDSSGRRYLLLVERERFREDEYLEWDVLEFENERLTAAYSYDEEWIDLESRPFKIEADFWNPPAEPRSGFFVPFIQARFTRGGLAVLILIAGATAGAGALLFIKLLDRLSKIPAVEHRLNAFFEWLFVRFLHLKRRWRNTG
jgi:hypothetical protein